MLPVAADSLPQSLSQDMAAILEEFPDGQGFAFDFSDDLVEELLTDDAVGQQPAQDDTQAPGVVMCDTESCTQSSPVELETDHLMATPTPTYEEACEKVVDTITQVFELQTMTTAWLMDCDVDLCPGLCEGLSAFNTACAVFSSAHSATLSVAELSPARIQVLLDQVDTGFAELAAKYCRFKGLLGTTIAPQAGMEVDADDLFGDEA